MSITFETAALADVVSKAARIAPTKGAAFDKAAGIVIEYTPGAPVPVTVKATDMEVTYLETLTPIECDDPAGFVWRLPSVLMTGILGNLPLGTHTNLEMKDTFLHIKCGKSKSKIRTFAAPQIKFSAFDEAPLQEVIGFASRVAQVSWACDKVAIPFTGVHITGTHLIATDRYKLVTVPMVVAVDEPITAPLDALTAVSKNLTDARLAAVGQRLHVMPTDHSQITSTIYDAKYPDVAKAMSRDYATSCEVDREVLRSAINRMLVLVKGERYPVMTLTIGKERIGILIDVPDVGVMEDEVAVVGSDHDDYTILFTPGNFVEGLAHAAKPTVKFSYDTSSPHKNIQFDDGDGYECWVVPRRSTSANGQNGTP